MRDHDEPDGVTVSRADESSAPASARRWSGVRWLLIGNVASAAAQLGLVAALTHRLAEGSVGDFVLALSVWAPAVMAANLGLRPVLASDAGDDHAFARYLRLRATCLGLAFVLIAVGSLLLLQGDALAVMLLVGAAKVGESLSDVCFGMQQKHAAERTAGLSLFVRSVLGLGLALVLLETVGGLVAACAALAAANLGVALSWDIPRANALARPSRSAGEGSVWRLVAIGAPLGATAVLISLSVNVPRYFVEGFTGRAALGVFGVLTYGVAAGALVMNALCNATARDLGSAWVARDRGRFAAVFRTFLGTTLVWAVAAIVGAIALGEPVLRFVFGDAYGDASDVFVWLMVAGGVTYVAHALQYTLTAVRSTAWQLVAVLVDLVVTTTMCWALVPAHGLMGAAYALIAGGAARVLLFAVAVRGSFGVLAGEGHDA
ncbi:MAG: lipopolysaccharide biosynthesis protein [Myxococcota bacterium]